VSAGSWASEMRLCQQSNENTGIGEAIARARDVRPDSGLGANPGPASGRPKSAYRAVADVVGACDLGQRLA
jgi:hypothetical protein